MPAIDVVVLVAYGLMAFELVVLPVPSEASTYQLLGAKRAHSRDGRALAEARTFSMVAKLLRFAAPSAIGVIGLLLPLAHVVDPGVGPMLLLLGDAPVLPWLACTLIVGGSGFTLVSVVQIRAQSKCDARANKPRALATQGLFAVSRNPGLVGNYTLYIGFFLYLPAVALAICFAVYVWNMHRRILMEESHLELVFGAHYRQYASQVPRYLRLAPLNV